MFSSWPIRKKLLLGISLLILIVGTLAISGFQGVYAYRSLVRSLRHRVHEGPRARKLAERVRELQFTLSQVRQLNAMPTDETSRFVKQRPSSFPRQGFREKFNEVKEALHDYRLQLLPTEAVGQSIGDNRDEWATVHSMAGLLEGIEQSNSDVRWWLDEVNLDLLNEELVGLRKLSDELPKFQEARVNQFTHDVRVQYRTWIALMWVTSVSAICLLVLLMRLFYLWIFQPLQLLIDGSRYVARGNFQHRVQLGTQDEMSELSQAMNAMTSRFQAIRDDLDLQVELRTKQAVRSEQLASVGFLAAGVAHEINNPLASIALCAESLEMRLHDIIQQDDVKSDDHHNQEITVTRNYLRMIQDEAFRCKQITENLLDFSRKGDSDRSTTDLGELVQGVIDMVGHVGKYKERRIRFHADEPIMAPMHPQEMKQVVLNIITNALESTVQGGTVDVEVKRTDDHALLLVTDDGCGMTDEVLQHLFDPFFTKRRDGKGTGLGLSISFRIVSEHGGNIDVSSDGPGSGAQFCVSLPLSTKQEEKELRNHYQAA